MFRTALRAAPVAIAVTLTVLGVTEQCLAKGSVPVDTAAYSSGTFFGEQCRHQVRDMQDARDVLAGKPQAEWTDQEMERYLFHAVFAVYYSLNYYLDENKKHPGGSAELMSSSLLNSSDWPGNPFNNWEPMTWADASAGFSAGNLVLQLCPPSMYTGVKVAPRPMTFTLGVYGPREDYKPINPPSALYDWDEAPDGVAFITGTRFSTSEEQRKRLAAQEERRQEAAKAEAEKQQAEQP